MARLRVHRGFDDWSIYVAEPALARRRRLAEEARDGKTAKEVDRSGSARHLERAAKRLKYVKAEDRVLYVPHWDLAKAESAMRRAGVTGAVSNLCGSERRRIKRG